MKPTDEQKKKFLEALGFTLRCPPEKDTYGRGIWNYPNGVYGDCDLDPNNLLGWAVPKLALTVRAITIYPAQLGSCYVEFVMRDGFRKETVGDSLADALFWACYKVLVKEEL